jgi:RNA polymerase sigma-70 factor (ECF subfamily)
MNGRGNLREALPCCDTAVQDAILQGEFTRALEVLMHHYQGAILRYCSCHLLDQDAAQEVAQDVFIAAFEGLPALRGHTSIKAWLYGIATNKCLEMRRNSTRRATLRRDYQALIGAYAHCEPPSSPEELCSRERQRRLVWEALRRLRVYDRELVVLRYLEDLLYEEIASILKVSQKTVERHLPRALARFLHAYERCQRHALPC